MRAAVVTEPGGPEVFKVIERDDPAFGLDEVLVDVKASRAEPCRPRPTSRQLSGAARHSAGHPGA